jgi:hypothetical protein
MHTLQESVRDMSVDNVVKMVGFLQGDDATRLFGAFFDNIRKYQDTVSKRVCVLVLHWVFWLDLAAWGYT